MKKLSNTLIFLVFSAIIFVPQKTLALVQYGDPCLNACDCCEVMLEYLTTTGSNELTNSQLVASAMMSVTNTYPDQNSRPILLQNLVHLENLVDTWLGAHGKLSSLEMCDWATNGQVCQAGCEPRNPTPGGPQDCSVNQVWTTSPSNPGLEASQKIEFFCFDCFKLNQAEYRCSAGYYGTPQPLANTGCDKCPDPGTSNPATTDITGCYIKDGITFSDENGDWTFTESCNYSE